jgi:predicted dehydrogenase
MVVAASRKIRVGIVGVGTWAEYGHIPSLKLLPGYEIAAVYSRDAEKARAVAARHGIRHPLNSLTSLAEHPEVDLVLVLTPAPQHEEGIRAAITAKKDVYSEWPLTPSKALSLELMQRAEDAGVRHIVGLQRRLAPVYRYAKALIGEGFIGELRSIRLHISVEYFGRLRSAALYYTVPAENYSSLLTIYGGHFLDALFHNFGTPISITGLTVNQFKEVTFIETGATRPSSTADEVVMSGIFGNGAVLSVHLEAGKLNDFGIQLDFTGTEGDLRISNPTSFGEAFNKLEGARGSAHPMQELPVPPTCMWVPPSELGGSVVELAHLYAAYARDQREGTSLTPTFGDALKMHEIIDQIELSSRSGTRVNLPC